MTPDPERQFFSAVAWWLFYTWRLRHDLGTLTRADIIGRRTERAEQTAARIADLRSFRRMAKDEYFYRAVFSGPRLGAHQMIVKIKGPVEIEIHQFTKDRWEAWYYSRTEQRATAPLLNPDRHAITASNIDKLKTLVREQFDLQIRGWERYNQFGKLEPIPAIVPKP